MLACVFVLRLDFLDSNCRAIVVVMCGEMSVGDHLCSVHWWYVRGRSDYGSLRDLLCSAGLVDGIGVVGGDRIHLRVCVCVCLCIYVCMCSHRYLDQLRIGYTTR